MDLWVYDVSELKDDRVFSAALSRVPWESRREKALRFRFAKDRGLSLGAGLLLAHALRRTGVTDLTLAQGEHGKPHLAHQHEIHFNLSHAGTLAVCAVADVSVGVDVEAPQRCDALVAERCFGEAERRWLQAQTDADAAFTRLWVRKESYLKLLGCGLTDDLASIDVTPDAPRAGGPWFFETSCQAHALALCAQSEELVSMRRVEAGFWRVGDACLP